jgi:hypothetical protein
VIREYGLAFQARFGGHLSARQQRVLRDVAACRTANLGGHVERCDHCGQERIAYNSCRNRHCPKCQGGARARWLEREAGYLLPVEYHHVVFTLPADEFLRRFLLHVLPRGFVKIRHYGLLANRRRHVHLEQCRQLLFVEVVRQGLDVDRPSSDAGLCPLCGQGRLRRMRLLPRATARDSYRADTS